MIEFVQWVGAVGGICAVFAILMVFICMKLLKIMREDRKFMEDRETGIIEAYNTATRENTKVLSELYTYLKAKNGSR